MTPTQAHSRLRPKAFTLIELLVAIAIIALLVSIALVAGGQVAAGARTSSTKQTLQALNLALDAMVSETGRIPEPIVVDPRDERQLVYIPIVDGRNMTNRSDPSAYQLQLDYPGGNQRGNQLMNSGGLFFQQALQVDTARAIVEGLPSEIVRPYTPSADAQRSDADTLQPEMATPFDAYGLPIRYVHPAFDGRIVQTGTPTSEDWSPSSFLRLVPNQTPRGVPDPILRERGYRINAIRRGNLTRPTLDPASPAFDGSGGATTDFADSDGGFCPNNRPYFYSVGDDGSPAPYSLDPDPAEMAVRNINDNVYLVTPEFDLNPDYRVIFE